MRVTDDSPKTRCSFQFFGQVQPNHIPQALLEELEHEIEEPTGITTVHPPEMKASGVLVSKDCAMLYELPDIKGMK
jgi:transmembrane E3 ubiquitin-protein ligase